MQAFLIISVVLIIFFTLVNYMKLAMDIDFKKYKVKTQKQFLLLCIPGYYIVSRVATYFNELEK